MRIENELKLDYSDVLLRPKRSRLGSRKEVSIKRNFLHIDWDGVPIMAANMDGVGTFAMAMELEAAGMFTCLKKNYDSAQLIEYFSRKERKHTAMSIGITDNDFQKFCDVYSQCAKNIKFICIDVANGYSERFVDFVRKIRHVEMGTESSPLYIIAGNVVTGEMTEQLILSGADIVKVGIGPGCFAPGQKVKTKKGDKNIEDVEIGEDVLTHKNQYKKVTNTFQFDDKKTIMSINNIKCTPNHEFYVLHKKHKDYVNDDNIHEFAEWICAENLTKEYLLLKL